MALNQRAGDLQGETVRNASGSAAPARGLVSRTKLLILGSLLAGATTYAVLSLLPEIYTSRVVVEARVPDKPDAREEARGVVAGYLKSDAFYNAVASDLARDGGPDFYRRLSTSGLGRRIAAMLGGGGKTAHTVDRAVADNLRATPGREPGSLDIVFAAGDAGLALYAINSVVDKLENADLSLQPNQSEAAVDAARAEVAATKESARVADKRLTEARRSRALERNIEVQRAAEATSRKAEAATNSAPRAGENTEQAAARKLAGEMSRRVEQLEEMLARGTIDVAPEMVSSALMRRLLAERLRAQDKVQELEATLLPRHPVMRQAAAELRGIKRQINAEARKIVENFRQEATLAQKHAQALAGRSTRAPATTAAITVETGTSVQALPLATTSSSFPLVKIETLQDEARAAQDAYKTALNKLQALQGAPAENSRIVVAVSEPPSLGPIPLAAKKLSFGAFVMAATAALGLLGALLGRGRKGQGKGASGAAGRAGKATGDPASVYVPPATAAGGDARREPRFPQPDEAAAMSGGSALSLVAIAGGLVTAAGEPGGFRTLVSGERTGINAMNEGIALAEQLVRHGRKTLVISWGPESVVFGQRFGLANAAGLLELARGECTVEDAVVMDDAHGFAILPMGRSRNAGQLVVNTDQLLMVLDALDELFDHIVIACSFKSAHALFGQIGGRVDAGVLVRDASAPAGEAPQGFLGFQVPDMATFVFERGYQAGASATRRRRAS